MTATDAAVEATPRPMIFLLGPPGVGKTTLGSRACKELGLEFLDLAAAPLRRPSTSTTWNGSLTSSPTAPPT